METLMQFSSCSLVSKAAASASSAAKRTGGSRDEKGGPAFTDAVWPKHSKKPNSCARQEIQSQPVSRARPAKLIQSPNSGYHAHAGAARERDTPYNIFINYRT